MALGSLGDLSSNALLWVANQGLYSHVPPALSAREHWTAVSSLGEALLQVRAQPIRMAVLDAALLERHSANELTELKRQTANVDLPVVLLARKETATELIELAASAGVDDCVLWPVDPQALRARLEALELEPTLRAGRRIRRTVLLLGRPQETDKLSHALNAGGFWVRAARTHPPDPLPDAPVDLVLMTSPLEEPPQVTLNRVRRHPPYERTQIAVVLPSGGSWVPREPVVTWHESSMRDVDELIARMDSLLDRPPNRLRISERVPFFCPVEFRESGGANWRSGFSADLSPGGIFLRTLVPERPGACVDMRVHLTPTTEKLEGTGVVAWANLASQRRGGSIHSGMGVEFLGMGPKELSRLRQICRHALADFPG